MKTLQLAIILILGISVIFLIAPQHASANTCSAKLTSYNAPQFYLLADGVFAGTVQHIDNTADHQWKVYFAVDKLWKGSISQKPSLIVMTNSLQGCGYSLVQGEKYLVYTNGYPPFLNTVWSKPYADAQSDIAIIDDPKFQSDEKAQEELNKKLTNARDAISNLMGSKMGDIPFNSVGVDVINSTLDIGIDSAKAVLSEEEYEKKIRDIVGDISIKITFGQNFATTPVYTLSEDSASIPLPPLQQFNSGISTNDILCKEGLYLAIASHDKEPVCLKAGTISELASRGFLYGINASQTNSTTILIPPGSEDPSSNKTYSPDVATVVLGVNSTVTWVNQAISANTIVPDMPFQQDGKSFGNTTLRPDDSYQFTFTEPGTFRYHGEPHPWQKGKIIVLPHESSNFTSPVAKTYHLKQIHYYDSSNLNPKVSLYDYSYDGMDKDGLVSIDNQTFYQTTLDNDIYKLKGVSVQFHNVTFSFPEGTLTTPGGAFVNLDVKFQDGFEEIYGGTMSSSDGSGVMVGGISIPTQYGPHMATNSVTILGNHTMPEAGLTIYHDKIKLLVSADNQVSQKENSTSALKLYMSADSDVVKPGQPIGIAISVNNTLATPIEIASQNNWLYQNVSTGPCSAIGYGISILDGFYDVDNMTQGKSLNLFNPGILCPYIQETAKTYEFQPQSGIVKESQCKSIEGIQCRTDVYQMGRDYKFSGYWNSGAVQPFKSGVYTIIGADEWGHVAIQHFIVTNSTIFAGNLGSMSCPLMYGGVQLSATIKNSTGFANYYKSEQYGNVFLMNRGTSGTVSVQYDSPANASWFLNNNNLPLNITNGAALYYMSDVKIGDTIVPFAVSLYTDESVHHSRICHYIEHGIGGFETPCNEDNNGDIPLDEIPYASALLKAGVTTSFKPNSVMLYPGSNPTFTATVSASPDALTGTYWLSLGRSLCGPGVLAKVVVVP